VISDPALRDEIHAYTANAIATSRILSSIDRFGQDPSILRFEMTPKAHARTVRSGEGISWIVRAVRPDSPPPQAPALAEDVPLD
jgi:hypothetical protein